MSMGAIDSGSPEERRLAAIVVSDVAGYSARMQRDETGTMVLVRSDFARMEELAAAQGGEMLNTMGDGMLLGFGSAVQAVTFALQIQAEFAHRRAMKPPEQALEHRIGIHVGEVFRRDGRVAGDGVNIAARLQAKAPVGGISVSQTVYDLIKGKIVVQAVALGPQEFKNITQKIPVYNLALPGAPAPAAARPGAGKRALITLVLSTALLAAISPWWWKSRAEREAAEKNAAAPAVSPALVAAPAVAEKSVAVLPFTNMSDDKDNAFFADGVHEDILTDLANLGGLKVISRTSVIQYRASTKPLRQIGTELGVAYILEGSVRRVGNKVRVTGQLINARTDEHVWAKTYDKDLTDIFGIQAELATEIATALRSAITPQEQTKLATLPTANMAAYDLYRRARFKSQEDIGLRDRLGAVLPLLESAVQLDPQFADAWAELAMQRLTQYRGSQGSPDLLARIREALDTAVRLAPDSFNVLWVQRQFYYSVDQPAERAGVSERIAQLYPNRAETRVIMASEAWFGSRFREALDDVRLAVSLDPRGLDTLNYSIGYLSALRRYDEIEVLQRVVFEVHPPSLQLQWNAAYTSFTATGSVAQGDALVAKLTPEALRSDSNAVAVAAGWALFKGDATTIVRLWEQSGSKWRFNNQDPRYDLLSVALSCLKLGQPDRAQPLLERTRDLLRAQLDAAPNNGQRLSDFAFTVALLGDNAAADRALAKLREVISTTPNQTTRVNLMANEADTLAWMGRKTEAIDLLVSYINLPGVPIFSRVHALQRSIVWWPLQGDPRFEALIADPKNNAPLY